MERKKMKKKTLSLLILTISLGYLAVTVQAAPVSPLKLSDGFAPWHGDEWITVRVDRWFDAGSHHPLRLGIRTQLGLDQRYYGQLVKQVYIEISTPQGRGRVGVLVNGSEDYYPRRVASHPTWIGFNINRYLWAQPISHWPDLIKTMQFSLYGRVYVERIGVTLGRRPY